MGGITPEILLRGDQMFTEFRGVITEQFVLQQLTSQKQQAFYWTPDSGESEIDFVIQKDGLAIPIEVKSSVNVRSRSLRGYYDKYKPEICIRTSLAGYESRDWMRNIPLYGILGWVQQNSLHLHL